MTLSPTFSCSLPGLSLGLLLALAPMAQAAAADPATRIAPPAGAVIGSSENGVAAWEGLPYAQPPVGPLRWRAPQPLAAWTGERAALKAGNVCPQNQSLSGQKGEARGNEDCLYLNVYAPQSAKGLPVMVWIHGGSFETGAGSDFDPRPLVREQNVVVVTVNYRLGALGFLAAPGLQEDGSLGNYGLLDQHQALRWVRQNIAAFGGEAGNVTVFGESAGGMDICQQLGMPGSRGLFDKAIIESGPCTASGITISRQEALRQGEAALKSLGCNGRDTACLRNIPAEKLALTRPPKSGTVPFAPLYGDPTLPQNPLQILGTAQANNVPLLIGSNLDEGRAFAAFIGDPKRDLNLWEYLGGNFALNKGHALASLFHYTKGRYGTRTLALAAADTDQAFACPTNDIARLRSRFAPVYSYEFRDRSVPIKATPTAGLPSLGAFHTSEIPFVMGTSNGIVDIAAFSPQQRELGHAMRTYWTNFARTGNPNGGGLAAWQPMESTGKNVLELRPERVGMVSDFRSFHQCDAIWK